ncbi:MAG: protein kinase [Halioglobus sp.]
MLEIVGKSVGRYEIQEHIGEGGMAHVYRAFDPQINRSVALKILKDEHCQDEERKSRFTREGEAAGALTHPNIVTIYDVGDFEGAPYIMMELLEGKTLGDLLQEGTEFALEDIMHIAMLLGDALDYAHNKGIVHRDMKPDNIVLSADLQSVKVADFGIARVETASEKESTQVGMMLGTPRYMSPEQASGTTVDGRSDLFAVGVILYEMITGKKAFDAESMPTLIMQIVQKDPLPIRQISKDTPVGLQKIVHKLLQKKPKRRFQTGQELRTALARERQGLLDDKEEQSGYLSLQVKWTAIMTTVLAIEMALCSALVYRALENTLTQQAIDSGISFSKFVAVQSAIPVLSEDWATLESFAEDAAARESFEYLVVSDHRGVIRVASDDSLVGGYWGAAADAEKVYIQGDTQVSDKMGVFDFGVPILFNQTMVGSVNVGMDRSQLEAALSTTARMMFILGLAIVLAVAVVLYVFNKVIAKNLLLATNAIKLFGQQQYETRISKSRADEFGELFTAFNTMADGLEKSMDQAGTQDEQSVDVSLPSIEDLDVSGIASSSVTDITIVQVPKNDDR